MTPINESKDHSEITKGSGGIQFEKKIRFASIKSPLENFETVEQKIEFRKDPLLNHWSRVNTLRAERVKQAASPNESFQTNLDDLVIKSGQKCFFCPAKVLKSTPKFPDKLNLGERIVVDNFTLFPNLFVFSEFHAVGTLGNQHFTPMNEISANTWKNAIQGSIKYFKAVYNSDKQVKYPSFNFNFLPPSASSILHPHIQIIQDIKPTKITEELLLKSKQYFKENGSNYWLDLIDSEKTLKDRFVSDNDFMCWVTTYSPFGKNELTGIVKLDKTDLTQFTEKEAELFGLEISKALSALFTGRNARSVNMAVYLGPIGENCSNHFSITVKIVTRPILVPNYTADVGFMELLHNEPIAEAAPEDIAKSVKQFF